MPQKRVGLSRARRNAGLTQEELAYRLGVDRSTVGRWEIGTTEPSAWLRPKLAKLLGLTRRELTGFLELDSHEQSQVAAAPEFGIPDEREHLRIARGDTRGDEQFSPRGEPEALTMAFNAEVQRREFLASVATAAVGAAAPESLVRLLEGLDAGRPPRRVGLSEIEAVEAAADAYMRLDLARNGDTAASFARSALQWSIELFDAEMSDHDRVRLCSAVGLLADRLGWSTYDSGSRTTAGKLLTFALDHAARGGDRDLRAHVMLDLSTVMTDSGYPGDGVEILGAALGDERVSVAERANLHAVCARHCASAGQRSLGLRHAALSEETLGRDDEMSGHNWARRITYSPGHHNSALGLAFFALDDAHHARQHLTTALAALDGGRTRTGLRCRIRLAILNLRDHATDAGETEGYRVISDATGVKSTRIRADLKMLHSHAKQYGAPGLAADLAPLMQTFA